MSFTGIPSEPPIWSFTPSFPFSGSPSPYLIPPTTTSTRTHLGSATVASSAPLFAQDMPISTMAANPFTRSTEAISEVPPIVPPLIRPPAPLSGRPRTHPYSHVPTSVHHELPWSTTSYSTTWPPADYSLNQRADPTIDYQMLNLLLTLQCDRELIPQCDQE